MHEDLGLGTIYARAYRNFLFLSFHSSKEGKLFEDGRIRAAGTITSGSFTPTGFFFPSPCNAYATVDGRNGAQRVAPTNSRYVCSLCVHTEQEGGLKGKNEVPCSLHRIFFILSKYERHVSMSSYIN